MEIVLFLLNTIYWFHLTNIILKTIFHFKTYLIFKNRLNLKSEYIFNIISYALYKLIYKLKNLNRANLLNEFKNIIFINKYEKF